MMRNKILFFINQEMKAFFYKDRFYVIKCCDIVQKNKVFVVKLGSRSKVNLKSQIRDLDQELVAIIAMSPTTTTHPPRKLF